MFYGEAPCHRAVRPLFDIGLDEGLLNFELLLRQLKDAIFVDLIARPSEKIGNLVRRGRRR